MIGVVDRVRESIVSSKEAILRMIAEIQKPVLDRKIDEMLKEVKKTTQIAVKYSGRGLGIGRKLGSAVRTGRRLLAL